MNFVIRPILSMRFLHIFCLSYKIVSVSNQFQIVYVQVDKVVSVIRFRLFMTLLLSTLSSAMTGEHFLDSIDFVVFSASFFNKGYTSYAFLIQHAIVFFDGLVGVQPS